jgi:hypothetical protein
MIGYGLQKKSIQMTKRNEIEKVMLSRRKRRTKTHIVQNKNKNRMTSLARHSQSA